MDWGGMRIWREGAAEVERAEVGRRPAMTALVGRRAGVEVEVEDEAGRRGEAVESASSISCAHLRACAGSLARAWIALTFCQGQTRARSAPHPLTRLDASQTKLVAGCWTDRGRLELDRAHLGHEAVKL